MPLAPGVELFVRGSHISKLGDERTAEGANRTRAEAFSCSTSTNLHQPPPSSRTFFSQSHRSDLNRRPLDYESRALPLSYGGVRAPNLAAGDAIWYCAVGPPPDMRFSTQ